MSMENVTEPGTGAVKDIKDPRSSSSTARKAADRAD